MKVIRLSKSTGESIITDYPRHDMDIIVNCDPDYRYYVIEAGKEPEYNPLTHQVKQVMDYDNEPNKIYFALGTCRISYIIEPLPFDQIIENMDKSVGNHIESRLPLWKQNKYLSRYIYLSQLIGEKKADKKMVDELIWLGDVDTWANQCRKIRDEKEKELLNNGVIPVFDWPEMPAKLF